MYFVSDSIFSEPGKTELPVLGNNKTNVQSFQDTASSEPPFDGIDKGWCKSNIKLVGVIFNAIFSSTFIHYTITRKNNNIPGTLPSRIKLLINQTFRRGVSFFLEEVHFRSYFYSE